MTNQEIERFRSWIFTQVEKAIKKDGGLVRMAPGWYMAWCNKFSCLVEIKRLDEGPHRGLWIAHERYNKWNTDPIPTLREIKQELGLS